MIAYITQQGAKVIRDGKRLIVQTSSEEHTLFSWELEQVLIFGNVTLTQPALRLLLAENVDVAYYQRDGKFLGRIVSEEPKNVFLRKRQFILTDDKEFCLRVAKSIVEGKLRNQAMLLQRIKRARNQNDAGLYAQKIKSYADEARQCISLSRLRGLEGFAALQYFKGFSCGFSTQWQFTKRTRRPPTDPVNAVLSLCYTLLIAKMYGAIRQAHLDPYPGVFHSLAYGRCSLPLDLVEEFRPLVADALTLSLFNMKMVQTKDFDIKSKDENIEEVITKEPQKSQNLIERVINDPIGLFSRAKNILGLEAKEKDPLTIIPASHSPHPVLLRQEAFSRVITAFSRKMETTFQYPLTGKEVSYTEAMGLQARQYRQVVEGKKEYYEPLLLR